MSEGPGYMPSSTPEELCAFIFGEVQGATMNHDEPTNRYHDYLELLKKNEKSVLEMKTKANAATFKRAYPKIRKNDQCPCGSGKKYKHCHMREQERQYVVIS